MSRELDAQVAERVMGLTIEHRAWPCYCEPECGVYEAALNDEGDPVPWNGRRDVVYRTHEPVFFENGYTADELGFWCAPVPPYSTDIAAAALVEDEIERRGLGDEYAMALLALKPVSDYEMGDHWFLVRATPEQRCRAALAAVS